MASITTILGTDSVSSSRIVLNNNFAALNDELADIANVLNTSTQVLTLTGLITGGTLRINNGSDLFKVESNEINANLPIKLNQEVVLGDGLIYSIDSNPTSLPQSAVDYQDTTYVLNSVVFNTTVSLAAASAGQEITLIANGGTITISNSNIIGVAASVVMSNGGSLTLRYITSPINGFVIISAFKCTVSGTAI